MTLSANFTSKSVFDQHRCRALTFALARLSCLSREILQMWVANTYVLFNQLIGLGTDRISLLVMFLILFKAP